MGYRGVTNVSFVIKVIISAGEVLVAVENIDIAVGCNVILLKLLIDVTYRQREVFTNGVHSA